MEAACALIAIVEDDARVRMALERLLQSTGHAVISFAGGTEFLAARLPCEPDCLVLDLHMPGLSGFEVQQRLHAAGRDVPVVVITGQDSRVARERALLGGARAYLCKPVDRDDLTAAIAQALNAKGECRGDTIK